MRRVLLYFIFTFFSLTSIAQDKNVMPSKNINNNGNAHDNAVVAGYIELPSLLKLTVAQNHNAHSVLNRISDYDNGKITHGIANVNIKSSRPWILNIMSDGPYAYASSGHTLPSSAFGFKVSTADQFVTISNTPRPIIISTNNSIENNYTLDMLVNPGFGYQSGTYSANVILTLTEQ